MRNNVTNRQLSYMLFLTITTGSLITVPKTAAVIAGHGAWITLLLTALYYAILSAIIVRLGRMFEGDTLFEYSRKLLGPVTAYVFAVLYILFFTVFSSYYCVSFYEMVKANFLLKTPEAFLLVFSMPFLGFIAYKGVTNVARLSVVVGVLFLVVSLVFYVTMFFEGHIDRMLPLVIPSEIKRDIFALRNSSEMLMGVTILTVVPIAGQNKKPSKAVFLTMLGMGLFYLLDIYGCYAMLGMDEIVYHKFPLIDAIRLIEYPRIEFFQRVDILYMTLGFMRVFTAKSIVYLCAVEYLCRLFKRVKRSLIVIFAGIYFSIVDIWALGRPGSGEALYDAMSILPLIFAFLIPVILFITAKVKKYG